MGNNDSHLSLFGPKWPALPPFENRAPLSLEFVAAPNLMPFALVVATPIQRLASRALLLIKNDQTMLSSELINGPI